MKKVFLAAFILVGSLAFQQKASAQIGVSINIGTQPAWGPTGYNYVQYYYLPDINCYYNVANGMYYYMSSRSNRWISAQRLPSRYAKYNLYNSYKVVINNRSGMPYMNNAQDVRQYGKYKGQGAKQPMIRDSRDSKYAQNPGNVNYRKPQTPPGRGGR